MGTVLHKDIEFAINLTYGMKKLPVVTLVNQSSLTLVVTSINLIRPILTS